MNPLYDKLSELTFQLIVESSPNAIVLVNEEGTIVYVNNPGENLFGYDQTELIGQPVEMLIPNHLRTKHPGFVESFFATPSVRAMGVGRELYAQRKDGSEFPIEIGLNPLTASGEVLVMASIIDITERKNAEELFHLVVNLLPSAMIVVNTTGNITLVNNEATNLFGYRQEEIINKKLEILIPDRFRAGHDEFVTSYFGNPQTRSMGIGMEFLGLHKNGKEIPVEIGLNPITTYKGDMVLASIIDISGRKTQEEREKRHIKLEIRNKELEQLTYIASHDLQEPLRTVSNFAQALVEDYGQQFDNVGKRYLDSIQRATGRMSSLVKSLLDHSRLGRDRKLVKTPISEIVHSVIADLQDAIRKSGATITVGNMPVLNVYVVEMRQLFQNLISNAIKFSKPNTPPVISIHADELHDVWEFSVHDNGMGIESIHFDRIFHFFQRLQKDDSSGGHGIGLPNSRKIVELHEGEIWVESVAGKGSSFIFTIPKTISP